MKSLLFIGLWGLMSVSYAHALQVHELKTSQGAIVWLAPQDGPVVALQIAFKGAGMCTDPVGKAGRADVFSDLVLEGAGTLDASELAAQLEDLCSSVHITAHNDTMICSVVMLRRHMDRTLELVRDILFKPRLEPHSLDKVKKQAIAAVEAMKGDPDDMQKRAFAQLCLTNHPYGRLPTSASLQTLTLDDMKDYKRFWGVDNLAVTMSGALSPEDATKAVEKLCKDLPLHADTVLVEDVVVPEQGRIYHLDLDLPQSMVHFFQNGLAPQHPDYHAVFVLNSILGNGSPLSSRLFKKVRVESGYAYTVHTSLIDQDHHVRWDGAFGSKNETVLPAIQLIQKEWERAAQKGVTEKELESAKRYLAGSWPLEFKTSQEVASHLMGLRLEGRDADYVNQRNTLISQVSVEDLKRVAKLYLKPEQLTFIIVGRPKQDPAVQVMPLVLDKAL